MTNPQLTAHYRERQLLNILILVLFLAFAWCADHYGPMAAGGIANQLTVVLDGAKQQ